MRGVAVGGRGFVARLVALVAGLGALTLLASSCQAATPGTAYDFNGDGHADLAWTDYAGTWRVGTVIDNRVIGTMAQGAFAVPGDYDGDGRIEVASIDYFGGSDDWVTSGAAGTIHFPRPAWPDGIPHASGNYMVPVPARYDGGAKDIPAWYREIDGTWFIQGQDPIKFGNGPTTPGPDNVVNAVDNDMPVPADYDGDGITDLAVYNPRTGSYRIRSSIDGSVSDRTLLATASDSFIAPVPGDYDHVGHAQAAVFGVSTGWFIEGHGTVDSFGADPAAFGSTWGFPLPVVADYNGDGRTEPAVWRPDGTWLIDGSWINNSITPWDHGEGSPVALTTVLLMSIARFTLVGRCDVNAAQC
jgi:hypothetical protein